MGKKEMDVTNQIRMTLKAMGKATRKDLKELLPHINDVHLGPPLSRLQKRGEIKKVGPAEYEWVREVPIQPGRVRFKKIKSEEPGKVIHTLNNGAKPTPSHFPLRDLNWPKVVEIKVLIDPKLMNVPEILETISKFPETLSVLSQPVRDAREDEVFPTWRLRD